MIAVANKKTFGGLGVYVGRPSVLGNPFPVTLGRERCIGMYEDWLRERWAARDQQRAELIRLAHQYKREGHMTLVCWCHPLPCHADVLARAIESIAAKL